MEYGRENSNRDTMNTVGKLTKENKTFINNTFCLFPYICLFYRVKGVKKEKNRRRHFTATGDEAVTDGDSVLS